MERNITPLVLSALVVLHCFHSPSAVHLTSEAVMKLDTSSQSREKASHSLEKRQAIVNPQAYTPLIPPQTASNGLNTPFTTTIGFFPNIPGKSHTDKCPRDMIEMVDGTCQYLMTKGSCKKTEEVILDFDTGKGICAERLCSPDRIFLHSTQLCHDPKDVTVCPAGREIFYSSYGTSVCACPDGTIETDDDLDDDVCEEILTPTLACSSSVPNTVRWLRDFNSMPECLPDPCGGTNLNASAIKDGLPFLPSDAGQCHRWGESEGTCPSETYFALAFEKVKGECSELEEAGYEIFDQETLDFFAREYGQLINKKTGPPVLPSDRNKNHGPPHTDGNLTILDGSNPQSNVIDDNLNAEGHDDGLRHRDSPLQGSRFHQPTDAFHTPTASGAGLAMRGATSPDSQVFSVNMQLSKVGQDFQVDRMTQKGPIDRNTFPGPHPDSFRNRPSHGRPSPNFQFSHGFDGNRVTPNGHQSNFNGGNDFADTDNRHGVGGNRGQTHHVPQQMDFRVGSNRNGPQDFSPNQPSAAGSFFPSSGANQNQFSQSIGFANQNQHHSRFPQPGPSDHMVPNPQGFQMNPNSHMHGFHSQQDTHSQGFHRNQGFQSHQGQGFHSNQGPYQQGFQQNQGFQSHQSHRPHQGFQSNLEGGYYSNQFNSPEIFDPNAPVSLEVFDQPSQHSHQANPHASYNSLEFREPYGMRLGRSLGVNPPVRAILKTHVTILPSGEKIVHKIPHPRRIRSASYGDEEFEGASFFNRFAAPNSEVAGGSEFLSRKKRSSLPFASPSNVFETRLLGCRPGSVRDINAKCRNTILPARVPKRRGIRASPPIPPSPSCPGNFARDIRRQCVPRTTARRSILANNLG